MARSRRWLVVLPVVLVLLAAAGLALFEGYVILFKEPDEAPVAQHYPPDRAVVATSRLRLEWPAEEGTGRWEVRVARESGGATYAAEVSQEFVELPFGVLKPGESYRWSLHRVSFLGLAEEEPVWQARFSTAAAAAAGSGSNTLTVFPARLLLGVREIAGGAAIEVTHASRAVIRLPDALVFSDGSRTAEGTGAWAAYPLVDLARAATDPEMWGEVTVEGDGVTLRIPVGPDEKTLGAFQEGVSTRFDPYRDTPAWANFTAGGLSELTQGTCLGIVLAVKLFWEQVEYGERPGVDATQLTPAGVLESILSGRPLVFRTSLSFRDLADKQEQLLTEVMSLLHFENLNPENWTATVRAILGDSEDDFVAGVWRDLTDGNLAVAAGFRLRKKVAKAGGDLRSFAVLDSGHAFLAYRGWRFADTTLLAVYDPNLEYSGTRPMTTVLIAGAGKSPEYWNGRERDRKMVRFMQVAHSKAFALAGLAAGGASQRFRSLVEAVRDLVNSF